MRNQISWAAVYYIWPTNNTTNTETNYPIKIYRTKRRGAKTEKKLKRASFVSTELR